MERTRPIVAPDWRSVVDHLPGAVLVLDLEGGIVAANAMARDLATSPLASAVGTPVWALPEVAAFADEIERSFAAAAAGADVEPLVIPLEPPDRPRQVVAWHSAFLRDGDGRPTHVLLTGHDVTRQHEAEVALRSQGEHYRTAIERADTVWWEIDLVTGEGVWPEAAASFYGVSGEAPHSLDLWRSTLHSDDRAADEAFLRRLFAERVPTFETENRIVHPERGLRWIRTEGRVVFGEGGEPIRLLGVDTDVTDRRCAEERLRQSEQDFRSMADSVPDIVWTAAADGTVTYYNGRWTDYSGATRESGEGWGWRPVLHRDDEEATIAAWFAALESGQPYEIEHRIRRHDGQYRWFVSRALPVKDDDGGVIKWYGTATDVHDQKEGALRLARRASQQAAVAELGILALQTADLPTFVHTALRRVCEVVDADHALLMRVHDAVDGRTLVLDAGIGVPESLVGRAVSADARGSQAAFTLATQAPVVISDVRTETRFVVTPLLRDLGVVSSLSVVVHGPDGPHGVLCVHTTEPRAFDPADADCVQAVANVVAEALKREEVVRALETRVRRLAALHAIDTAITEGTHPSSILQIVVEHVQRELEIDAVAVLVHQPDLQVLEFGAGTGFRSQMRRQGLIGLGAGLVGSVALERRPRFVRDVRVLDIEFARPELFASEGFVTYWGLPLLVKGELQGVLELFHRSPIEPDDDWHAFLTTLSVQAAIAINNASLFTNLQASHDKLRLAYDATIEGWARALDLKDHKTVGHSRRVTELTVQLAKHLGMAEDEIVPVRRGALLHDIGKMAIPDRILLKESELDAEEWTVMREHPSHAFDLLAGVPFLRDALDIPYCHHERWDGSGYPQGLAGLEIPLAARIFAVADVFDALISERPYWPAWSRDRALAYIAAEGGRHFDPDVAEAFVAMMTAATS